MKNGFKVSYADEQFKDNNGVTNHIYIPMVCFCDIPLNNIDLVTYGGFAIGVDRVWGNSRGLTPVAYYPINKENYFYKYISGVFEEYNKSHNSDLRKILGFVKPFRKLNEKNYAIGKRRENYIEREWRKVYFKKWIVSSCPLKTYNKSITINGFVSFSTENVSFIIVPNDVEKSKIISQIKRLKTIGSSKNRSNSKTKLDLISKVLTIKQIKENF